MSDLRTRTCPRCHGIGTIYRPLVCMCGHLRADHIDGVGCVGYSGHCEDDCRRFRKDPEQDSEATLARERDGDKRRLDDAMEHGRFG